MGGIISKVLRKEINIQANSSAYERAKYDKDKAKKSRKSPDVNKMYGLRVNRCEFYFANAKKRKEFWDGDGQLKGYKEKLIKDLGQERFDELKVEMFKN